MKPNQSKTKETKIYKSVEEVATASRFNAKHEAAKETIKRIGIEKIAALK